METGPPRSGQEGASALRAFLAWSTGQEGGWQAGEGAAEPRPQRGSPWCWNSSGRRGGPGGRGGRVGWTEPAASSPQPLSSAPCSPSGRRHCGLDLGLKDLELGSFLLQAFKV